VRILWAEKDAHFPLDQGERLARILGGRVEVVPGGTHWMAWAEAERVARYLGE
jgi:pimeloyl-ACP methyl ester carboxylesterase